MQKMDAGNNSFNEITMMDYIAMNSGGPVTLDATLTPVTRQVLFKVWVLFTLRR
jgi:hypothetical protein